MSNSERKNQSVKSILNNFKKNIFGIEYYYDKFGDLAQGVDVNEVTKSKEFIETCLKEIGIDINDTKKDNKNISRDKVIALVNIIKKQPKISIQNYEILSRSSFLMLNNYFEYLLSDLLSYHYNKFQKSLNEKKFTLALKEINEYDSIEEVTKALITKEIESMMVDLTFDELLDHFCTNLGISQEEEIINWNVIKECRERRHLIVHNSSIVNKKYLSRTKSISNFKIGDTIQVDKEYFAKSCKEIYLAGLLISFNCWGKWDKDETTRAIYEILVDSFELLKQKEYSIVSRLTNYIQKIEARNEVEEDYIFRIKINKLIALKQLGDNTNLQKELKKIKVGTASPIFRLAIAILSDNHKVIIDLVKQAKTLNEIDVSKYNEWPIFDFIRANHELNSKIEKELKIVKLKSLTTKKRILKKE